VLAYQANGLPGQIQLAPRYYVDGLGGWNVSQNDGIIVITFPGYAPKDYSLEVENMGVLTNGEGNPFAAINVTLGADATNVKAAVVSVDEDAEEVAAKLASGELEGTEVADGNNFIAIPENLTGKLMVVLAVIDNGEAKEVYTSAFEYYGGGANPWESVGTGDYVYSLFFTDADDNPQTDPGLELQYNADEDAYRITHWGYNVDFTFKMDKTTNLVTVPSQYVGYTDSSYGEVYVCEADVLNPKWETGQSYYEPETLTFHFRVAYFVSAGVFAKGEETFTLTPAQARAMGLEKTQKPSVNTSLKPVKKTTVNRMIEKEL
jgi:hypothetical protein